MEESKKIYIVLTHTGTALSKLIKVYTGAEFSHVSISLDENLKQMYSFGRLRPYNPFIGGLVHESLENGTFKRFNKTYANIYSVNVTKTQYESLKDNVLNMYKNKNLYKFNILGLFANGLHISLKRKNYFYCAEFIKHLTDKVDLDLNLPTLVRPIDFKKSKKLHLEYRGILNKYKGEESNV